MKTILFLLFAVSFPAAADMCLPINPGTNPRLELKAKESYVRVMEHPTEGGNALLIAYPTVTRDQICCSVSHFDPGSIDSLLTARRGTVAIPATEFAISLIPVLPWATSTPQWATQACQEALATMTAAGVNVPYRVVRNTSRPDGARPMSTLVNGTLAPLKINNVQVYVEAGRICDRAPVVRTTPSGLWLNTRNVAGVIGVALCK